MIMLRSPAVPDSSDADGRVRPAPNHLIGMLCGLLFSSFVGLGHRLAGGSLPPLTTALPWLTAVAFAGALLSGLRWTFPRLLAVFVIIQPLAHLVLAGRGPAMTGDGAMSMAGVQPSMAQHSAWMMMATHTVAAVLIAVVVRYGWIWISTMPLVIRAVVWASRRAIAWPMTKTYRVTVAPQCGPTVDVSKVWRSRGPPCGSKFQAVSTR